MTDAVFDALIDATFGKTQAEATKRVPESERRRSRLHWLFADADTPASIRDRRVMSAELLSIFVQGIGGEMTRPNPRGSWMSVRTSGPVRLPAISAPPALARPGGSHMRTRRAPQRQAPMTHGLQSLTPRPSR